MKTFRADLHIHTILSPCGDLEMSPVNIVERARQLHLDIIGITDHNATLHGPLTKKLAAKHGITVLTGAEVTTKEEIHCLAFFDSSAQLALFQTFLEHHLPDISNDVKLFGEQIVVDENENIIDEPTKLLISALSANISEVEAMVHRLGGIFIPAHVDRPRFSLISQLGFIPSELKADAMEVHKSSNPAIIRKQQNIPEDIAIIKNSDAHFLSDMGSAFSVFTMNEPTFDEIRKALKGADNRKVVCG